MVAMNSLKKFDKLWHNIYADDNMWTSIKQMTDRLRDRPLQNNTVHIDNNNNKT